MSRVQGSKGKVEMAKPTPRVEGRSARVEGQQRVARVTTSARLGTLLALCSVVLSFAAVEALVRLAKPDLSIPQASGHFRFTQSFEFELPHHLRDPVLGWRLQPGIYGSMRINSLGFRGPEWRTGKSATKRIAHLGDSSTMGFTIADDGEIYAALLPRLVQRDGLELEALNFGVDGYSSYQGRILLEQVLGDFAPDYVTIYFGYNDHHFSNASDRETRFSTPGILRALEHSHAYRLMRRHLLRWTRREADLREPTLRVDLASFESNLRAMVEAARVRGAVPILMTTPLRPGVPLVENEVRIERDGKPAWVTQDWWVTNELRQRGLELEGAAGSEDLRRFLVDALQAHPDWAYLHFLQAREFERAGDPQGARAALGRVALHDRERSVLEQYNERVRSVSRSLHTELVDIARMCEARPSPHLFNDVVHPSPAGHKLIAQALAEALLRLEGRKPSRPEEG